MSKIALIFSCLTSLQVAAAPPPTPEPIKAKAGINQSKQVPAEKPCVDTDKIYKVCTDQNPKLEELKQQATNQKKLVLITFGAEWCGWCKSLHAQFEKPEATKRLDTQFILSDIGVYMYDSPKKTESGVQILNHLLHVNKMSKSIINGFPIMAVVDPKTEKAIFIPTGNLEENKNGKGHDIEKVFAALTKAANDLKK